MVGGNQATFAFMDEYDWLYTIEERREAKKRRLWQAIHPDLEYKGGQK